jgi:hypothetical protein
MFQLVVDRLLVAFGVLGVTIQVVQLFRAWSSRTWATGEAVIVSGTVQERRGRRGTKLFEPTVEYRYKFGDREFTGNRIAFGDLSKGTRIDAEQTLGKFAIGSRRPVSICATDPTRSVLQAGTNRELWMALMISVFFALMFVYMVLF